MSTVREAQAEFTSIASNVDSVWVRWFGYSRTAENTVHVIDNDIKHLTFDLGHHSTYQPDKVLGTIMYQTLDDAWLPMHSDACYVVFSTDIPCKVRLLKYVDGKCTLFRFDDTTVGDAHVPCSCTEQDPQSPALSSHSKPIAGGNLKGWRRSCTCLSQPCIRGP
jgi:hypothetical protein